jgi:hypothetical protein
VVLVSHAQEGYQPCVASTFLNGDSVLDVEVVASTDIARTIDRPVTLSGIVRGRTSEGVRPIAGAGVMYDWLGDDGTPEAYSPTDAEGRYEMCGLLADPSSVYVIMRGFPFTMVGVSPTGDLVLDITIGDPAGGSQ